jgi:hypothetical protein
MILSNVPFFVMGLALGRLIVVAFFTIADKLSGVNYRTHINPEELK